MNEILEKEEILENGLKAPWLKSKDPEVPATLTYSTLSMSGKVEEIVERYPDYIAYEFMGRSTTYAKMWDKIVACAKALKALGIQYFDRMCIAMDEALSFKLFQFPMQGRPGHVHGHGPL